MSPLQLWELCILTVPECDPPSPAHLPGAAAGFSRPMTHSAFCSRDYKKKSRATFICPQMIFDFFFFFLLLKQFVVVLLCFLPRAAGALGHPGPMSPSLGGYLLHWALFLKEKSAESNSKWKMALPKGLSHPSPSEESNSCVLVGRG